MTGIIPVSEHVICQWIPSMITYYRYHSLAELHDVRLFPGISPKVSVRLALDPA